MVVVCVQVNQGVSRHHYLAVLQANAGRSRMGDERRWTAALVEHETVVRAFLTACQGVASADWQRAPAPGKWSPAAVVLHVCQAYELGRDSVASGPSMRLRVAPPVAWFSRTLILPVILATKRFPRGATAPAEIVPDAAEARLLLPDAAATRVQRVSEQAAAALRRAAGERPVPRLTHAYFGALNPLATLRLLSAHTRHHARRLNSGVIQQQLS